MGFTYDVLIGDFYDRLGYRTVGVLEDCPGRDRDTLVLQGPSLGSSEAGWSRDLVLLGKCDLFTVVRPGVRR